MWLGLRGPALYPSCSVTRGLPLISSRSHKNREKKRPLTGRGFFFSPPASFRQVNRMSAPSHFREESSYSLGFVKLQEEESNLAIQISEIKPEKRSNEQLLTKRKK